MKTLVAAVFLVLCVGLHTVSAYECNSESCKNGGTCFGFPGDDAPSCLCAGDYYGNRCQYKSSCSELNPCQNNATCTRPLYDASPRKYRCLCPDEYVGTNCQYENPCFNTTNKCQNGGRCYYRLDPFEDKAVQMCLCNSSYKGDLCEKSKCSVYVLDCFADLTTFGVRVKSLDMSYRQCRDYADELVSNVTACQATRQLELKSKKDCNCDAMESMALFSEYSPMTPYPKNNVASHCLATAYDSNATDATLPKCPQRTVECFQCLHKLNPGSKYKCREDTKGDTALRKACADDFFAGRLEYDNCGYMKTEITTLALQQKIAQLQNESGDQCNIYSIFHNCMTKLKDVLACGMEDSEPFRKCLQDSFMLYTGCKRVAEIFEKLKKDFSTYFMQSYPDQTQKVCHQMATFKDKVRSTWKCPADASWDNLKYKNTNGGNVMHTGIMVVIVAVCNFVAHLFF